MRVFVTGGTGFIGSRIVQGLISNKHDVLLLSRNEIKNTSNKIEIAVCDLSNIDKIKSLLTDWKPQACIHLAWYAEPGKYHDSVVNIDYLNWSLNLQKLILENGCKKIIVAGTCAEYEFTDKLLTEDSSINPQSLYAASKSSLYLTGKELAKLYDASFIWARIFFPYGPGEDPRRAVAATIRALINDEVFKASEGKQIRDYLYVDDIANAFITLLESEVDGSFNISSGKPVSVKELMLEIGESIGRANLIKFGAIPFKEWDPPFICGDNSKLKALGWKPLSTLKEGIKLTVDWWKKNEF